MHRRATLALLLWLPFAVVAQVQVREPGAALRGLGIDVQAGDTLLAWRGDDADWHGIDDALAWWQLERVRAPRGPLLLRLRRGDATREIELPGGRWDWQLQDVDGRGVRAQVWSDLQAAAGYAAARQWEPVSARCAAAAAQAAADTDAALDYCWQLAEANPDRQAGVALARALVARSAGRDGGAAASAPRDAVRAAHAVTASAPRDGAGAAHTAAASVSSDGAGATRTAAASAPSGRIGATHTATASASRDGAGAARTAAASAPRDGAGAAHTATAPASRESLDATLSATASASHTGGGVALTAAETALLQARAQLALARSTFTTRDYVTAAAAAEAALRLAGGAAARNTIAAAALQVLGFIDYRQGRLDAAMANYVAAERTVAGLAPGSLQHAGLRGAIATVHGSRGDLDTAVAEAEQALAQMERIAPAQMSLGRLQYNAGLMAFERGRLDTAERHLAAAMATFALASPNGSEAAMSRAQLAQTLERRGESARADVLLRDAVAAGQQLGASAYETLSMRLQLAIALHGQQRRAEALRETEAVALATAGERDDTLHADALSLRAQLRLEDGALDAALADTHAAAALLRARDRRIQLAPVLEQQGEALRRLRRYDEAARSLDEALQLRRRYAPQTMLEAQALLARARLVRDRGDADGALADFAAALDALEAQRDLLGGNEETRARWAARSAPFYREMLAQLLAMGRNDAAWLLLERYRAREFLATVGQRRDALLAHVDAPLRAEARAIAEDYLRAQKQAQAGTLLQADTFARLRQRSTALQQRLVAAEPRLADLAPRAALAADVAAALPEDAALVSYAVLDERSWAFVLRRDRPLVQVFALDAGADALGRDIDALRLLITLPAAGDASRAALQQRAAALHTRLIAPLEPAIGAAARLYLIADGPLHRLPFAVLRDENRGDYLVQRHAPGLLVSAAAFLGRAPASAVPARIAVFAAPAASGAELPAVRREAAAIAALFGDRARVHLGADASPAAALDALRDAGAVHFAGHAVVDPAYPLDSFLRLGDDARLSAWDVMRAAPLRAELVTLAACDSALGFNAGGEGLVGLTRAFQFAGAGTVVATLWRVADAPTEQLMRALYAQLVHGASADLALAHAQRELLASRPAAWQRWLGLGEDLSHPYYWSGFVASGVR